LSFEEVVAEVRTWSEEDRRALVEVLTPREPVTLGPVVPESSVEDPDKKRADEAIEFIKALAKEYGPLIRETWGPDIAAAVRENRENLGSN